MKNVIDKAINMHRVSHTGTVTHSIWHCYTARYEDSGKD